MGLFVFRTCMAAPLCRERMGEEIPPMETHTFVKLFQIYMYLSGYTADRENKGKKVSVRYQGQLILLELYYTNIGTRGDMISYQYRPIALPVDFKAEEVDPTQLFAP